MIIATVINIIVVTKQIFEFRIQKLSSNRRYHDLRQQSK